MNHCMWKLTFLPRQDPTQGTNDSELVSKFYYSTTMSFYHIRAMDHARYAMVLHSKTEQKYRRKME